MSKHILYRIFIAVACVTLITVSLLYAPAMFHHTEQDVLQLTDWVHLSTEGVSSPVELPYSLQWDEEGSSTLVTHLPEDMKTDRYICFWTYYCSVDVYAEDTSIYHYHNAGTDSFGAASTSQWHYVAIPDDADGKQLTIRLNTAYTDITPRFKAVLYGDLHALHHQLNQRYYLFRFMEDCLLWIGILLVILAVIMRVNSRYKWLHVYSGLFLLLFSTYLRTATKSLPLEYITPFLKDFLCYFSMFTLSIPLTLYTRCKISHRPKETRWCDLLVGVEMLVAAIGLALHAFHVVDIHYTLPAAMLLLVGAMITGIVYAIRHSLRHRHLQAMLSSVAPLLILVIFMVEYLQFYHLGDLPFDTGLISHFGAILVLLVEGYLFFYHNRQEKKQQSRIEEEHRSMQLQMLTDNMRPHFILNTIGAIRTLIPKEPERAADLLWDFSRYIRENLEQKDYYKPVPFAEELEYIRTYLSLERARFGDTVQVFYNCTDTQFRILPLTVQPFVENAIKHGLFNVQDGGKLWISSTAIPEGHQIEIVDNGEGFDTRQLEQLLENKKSVGMRSAILRLENEMNATVSIQSDAENGTRVRIRIPKK